MAELNTDDGGGGKKKHGKQRAKKSSTRIDMTPMVDLGFLLLTFFILTTTFNKPQAMQLTMPKKIKDPSELENSSKVDDDHTLNILLTKDNTVYWYFGIADPNKGALPALNKVSYGPNGLRKILIEENNKRHRTYDEIEKLKNMVAEGKLPKDSLGKKKMAFFDDPKRKTSTLTVLLKPDKDAKYKNIVDALDEMAICNIGIYALLESNPIEDQMIANASTYTK